MFLCKSLALSIPIIMFNNANKKKNHPSMGTYLWSLFNSPLLLVHLVVDPNDHTSFLSVLYSLAFISCYCLVWVSPQFHKSLHSNLCQWLLNNISSFIWSCSGSVLDLPLSALHTHLLANLISSFGCDAVEIQLKRCAPSFCSIPFLLTRFLQLFLSGC